MICALILMSLEPIMLVRRYHLHPDLDKTKITMIVVVQLICHP